MRKSGGRSWRERELRDERSVWVLIESMEGIGGRIWEESERRSRRLWLEGRRTDREKNDRQGEESEEGEDEGEGGLASTCP